jgi:hypothetical protein
VSFNFDEFERPGEDGVVGWFRPTGSTFMDGLRLAIINTGFVVFLLIAVSIGSLLLRLASWVLPIPVLVPALFIVVAFAVFGLIVWQRYAAAHGEAAMLRGKQTRPDVFGLVAALPFIAMALLLLSSGILSLFFAVITFSGGRSVDALFRILYGGIFTLAAAANMIIARAASDQVV